MARISAKSDSTENQLLKFGAVIRARRKSLGISQEALAELAEIDRSHMGKIERGERNVTFLNISRIANALQCKASQLLTDADL